LKKIAPAPRKFFAKIDDLRISEKRELSHLFLIGIDFAAIVSLCGDQVSLGQRP
jgi:hypothetical protein